MPVKGDFALEVCRPSTLLYAVVIPSQNMVVKAVELAESNATSFDLIGELHLSKLKDVMWSTGGLW